jgi:hypothetical protein
MGPKLKKSIEINISHGLQCMKSNLSLWKSFLLQRGPQISDKRQINFDQFLIKTPAQDSVTVNDFLQIHWKPGNVCTSDCIYCGPIAKDGRDKWPDFKIIESYVDKIHEVYNAAPYNKKHISHCWQGGEVTVWAEFGDILRYTHGLGDRNVLLSNGVRQVRWWQENARYLNSVCLSYHPESADMHHLAAVANCLAENGVVCTILVLMLPSYWDRCLTAIDYLSKNAKTFSISPRPLHGIRDANGDMINWYYTPDQWHWFKENPTFGCHIPFDKANFKYTTHKELVWRNSRTGEISEPVHGEALVTSQQNCWKDWHCYIGIDSLSFESNGEIRCDSMCRVVPAFGNWRKMHPNFVKWPVNPVLCTKNRCHCPGDFWARKSKELLK